MLVRVIRAVVGTVLLLVGIPLLLAGGVLAFAMQHRDADGAYRAPLARIQPQGYAVVAPDVDALLRRDAPFARGGRTTLRVSATAGSGPAFVGLAPAEALSSYLHGVPHGRVREVRLARGPLPVEVVTVPGSAEPVGRPGTQPFWVLAGRDGTVEWNPADLRTRQLALVVMDPGGRVLSHVDVVAEVEPAWLGSTAAGLLVLGTVLILLGVGALAWPGRAREIVYVVPPTQVPEVAAQLGVPVPALLPRPVSPAAVPDGLVAAAPAAGAAPPEPAPAAPPVVAAPVVPPAGLVPPARSARADGVLPPWPPLVPHLITAPPAPAEPAPDAGDQDAGAADPLTPAVAGRR